LLRRFTPRNDISSQNILLIFRFFIFLLRAERSNLFVIAKGLLPAQLDGGQAVVSLLAMTCLHRISF
jgi:hypothetical protein